MEFIGLQSRNHGWAIGFCGDVGMSSACTAIGQRSNPPFFCSAT